VRPYPYSRQLVLKGGILVNALSERRPTRDIDLQVLGIPNDADSFRGLALEIALMPLDDGIDFKTHTATAMVIREADQYDGIRVAMDASVHSAHLRLKVDFSVGDPVWPEPIQTQIDSVMPGLPHITLLSFPITMVLAEKIVTAVSRGTANTRWRDFASTASRAPDRSSRDRSTSSYGALASRPFSVHAAKTTGLTLLSPYVQCTYKGQPMTTEPRDHRWAFRVKAYNDALVREAATLSGVSLTAFVEESAVARAEAVIAERQAVTFSDEAFSRFVDALDEAPVVVPELVDLFSRPSRIPRA